MVSGPRRRVSSSVRRLPSAAFQQGEFVAGSRGENAHAFLVGHRLDERNPRNRVGVHQLRG